MKVTISTLRVRKSFIKSLALGQPQLKLRLITLPKDSNLPHVIKIRATNAAVITTDSGILGQAAAASASIKMLRIGIASVVALTMR